VRRSEFATEGELEGWGAVMNVSGFAATGGVLRGTATSGDPFFSRGGLRLAGDGARRVLICFRADAGAAGQPSLKPAIETADYADERGYHKIATNLLFTRRDTCLGAWFFLYPVLSA
jgi:hypothetical protein